jgi:hypothetical protein
MPATTLGGSPKPPASASSTPPNGKRLKKVTGTGTTLYLGVDLELAGSND